MCCYIFLLIQNMLETVKSIPRIRACQLKQRLLNLARKWGLFHNNSGHHGHSNFNPAYNSLKYRTRLKMIAGP